jgi:hypothetical protein
MESKTEKEEEKKIRKAGLGLSALGGIGAAGAIAGGYQLRKQIKPIADLAKKTTPLVKKIDESFQYSPLDRSPKAKAKRRVARQRSKRAASKILEREKRSYPKWRKALNKLPGGKIRLFENPITQRVHEKKNAKIIAKGLVEFERDPLEILDDVRKVNRKVRSNVKTGRKGVEAVRDLRDLAKGERRNKRRKRFYEKQHFKDAAAATAITAALGGAAYLSKTKKGKKLLKKFAEINTSTMEFAIEDEMKKKGWRMSRPTGSSVRVHTSGKKRDRRGKYWHERKSSRDKMLAGGATATAGLGLIATVLGRKYKSQKALTEAYKSAARTHAKQAARRRLKPPAKKPNLPKQPPKNRIENN